MHSTKALSGAFPTPLGMWRCFRDRRAFAKANPDFFDPDGILLFVGPQGSGKTLSAVQYVKNLLSMYPKCVLVSNIEILGLDYLHWTDGSELTSVSNGQKGVIYLVDEIQLYFNSLKSKDVGEDVFVQIAQQRKQRKHIVGTTQVFGRLAKPFREQLSAAILCANFLGCIQYNQVLSRDCVAGETADLTLAGYTSEKHIWLHTRELYGSYDTYDLVKGGVRNDD